MLCNVMHSTSACTFVSLESLGTRLVLLLDRDDYGLLFVNFVSKYIHPAITTFVNF